MKPDIPKKMPVQIPVPFPFSFVIRMISVIKAANPEIIWKTLRILSRDILLLFSVLGPFKYLKFHLKSAG